MKWVFDVGRTFAVLPQAAGIWALLVVLLATGSPVAVAEPPDEMALKIRSLAEVSESRPQDAGARFGLGVALLQARRYDEAIAAFEATARLQEGAGAETSRTYNALGWTRMLAGRLGEAEKAFLEALGREGSADVKLRQKILNNLGVLYIQMGDFDPARKVLTEAEELGSATARRELEKLNRLEASKSGG